MQVSRRYNVRDRRRPHTFRKRQRRGVSQQRVRTFSTCLSPCVLRLLSLSASALEVYYKRTLTGEFFGTYKLSLAFEDLIRQMVEPSASLRLPSCARGLLHPFFSLRPPSALTNNGADILHLLPNLLISSLVFFCYSKNQPAVPPLSLARCLRVPASPPNQ